FKENSSYTDIAIDSKGNAHICYFNYKNGYSAYIAEVVIKYATNSSGTWHTETISDTGIPRTAAGVSIAVDSNDNVYAVYKINHDSPPSELHFAKKIATGWDVQKNIDDGYHHPSCYYGPYALAFDSSDNAHIIYNSDCGSWGSTRYATNENGVWEYTEVYFQKSDYGASIAIDSFDKPHYVLGIK
ncbi:hypothetical protein, partial [Desulfamplus magnetovallimortis]|uniref:hypothetical protein n=1 Tax=Desulfamplus magnetovallimortis TaxID=1246637 RepID=UPI001C9877C8